MLQIAYFSPLPPQRTGVADYSAELLPYLSEEAGVTLFVEDTSLVSQELREGFPMHSLSEYASMRWQYDVAIYHIGNSPFHARIYEVLRRFPGVTVLHDHSLAHLVTGITLGQGNLAPYVRELAYERGRTGVARAHAVILDRDSPPLFEWPLNRRVVDSSVGVLVHSNWVRRQLLTTFPRVRVQKVDQPVPLPALRDRRVIRARLGLPEDAFVAATCGQITSRKCPDLVWEALVCFRRSHPDAVWLVIGEAVEEEPAWLEALGGSDRQAVRWLGYVEGLGAFYDHLSASDVCINLRCPTAGETSASVLRAMAVGLPVIVSDVGWYTELPQDCSVRISHNGTEVEQLCLALERWYASDNLRLEAGRRARDYVAHACDPARVAREYVSFVKSIGTQQECQDV